MSDVGEVLGDLHAALERIGLEVIGDHHQNIAFGPLSAVLAAGPLVFLCDGSERDKLLEWFGVSRGTSDSVFADALRALAEDFKERQGHFMYWQLAASPSVSLPARCVDLVEKRLGIPILVTDFPSPGEAMINSACESGTQGGVKDILSGTNEESIALVNAVFFWEDWKKRFRPIDWFHRWWLPESSHAVSLIGARCMCKYASSSSYHYIALPFDRESREMEIYMTKRRSKLPLGLTFEDMSALRASAKLQEMKVLIPKWSSHTRTSVSELLARGGVAFDKCLSNVAEILNDAFVDVTRDQIASKKIRRIEPGLRLDQLYGPREEEESLWFAFKVNRPFIYTIRSGPVTVLMGYVHDAPACDGPWDVLKDYFNEMKDNANETVEEQCQVS